MSKSVWITTAGDLTAFLEAEIAAGRNPSTPEQWAEAMERFAETGRATLAGEVPDDTTAGYIAGSLRDEGLDAHVLRRKDA